MQFLDFREPVSAWTHCAGVLLALPATVLLWRRTGGQTGKRLALLIYGLTLAFCYLASTLFHGVRASAASINGFARLDNVGIFALIAGSYTPLAWCLLRGQWRRWTLVAVWTVAVTATIVIAVGNRFSITFATCLYMGMGWGVVLCYFEIARAVSHRALLPVVLGGLSYTRGRRSQPSELADPHAGCLWVARAVPRLRARGQRSPLSLPSQGRRAIRADDVREIAQNA